MTTPDYALKYVALGWGLCSIPPGTKGPTDAGWNNPANIIKTPWQAQASCAGRPAYGLGLVHSASGTCAIDVDHLEYFRACLAELGTDPDTLFADAPRIIGKEGRDKAIFRLPAGEFKTHKLVWPARAAGEKPVTIFELRAGIVQDVLPPSIHPDTQQPYRWRDGFAPWDRPVPELPPALVVMWRAWDSFKAQLMAVCPWLEKSQMAPTPKPRTRAPGQHSNVIGQFNQAHDVVTMLEAHGYKSRGKRWLSPTSSSGLAGVTVFEDGTHCYSHHASDPLNDGHAHDAFSVFCLLDHAGDMTAAVSAAAEILGINTREPEAVAVVDIRDFMSRSAKTKHERAQPAIVESVAPIDATATPSQLLRMPGVLGDVVDLYNRTAPKPQPQFAVQAAIALGAVVLGRRWKTTRENWSSLYLVNVGKSASGKEHARTVVEACLYAAELTNLIGPSGYTSDSAVFSTLNHQPAHISIIDEIGELLGSAQAQGNFHKRQAVTELVKCWGLPHGTLRAQGYSTMSLTAAQRAEAGQRVVHRPSLSMLGMTTPKTFYRSLTEQSIEGGFLNRLLIVETHIGRQLSRVADTLDVPESVTQWCQEVRGTQQGNLTGMDVAADQIPVPRVVDLMPEAASAFRAYERDCLTAMDRLESEGLAELEGRSVEKALRIALILAVSDSVTMPFIRAEHADWAIAYVKHYTAQTVDAVRKYMHGSQFATWRAEILEVITRGGQRGRTEREMANHSRVFAGMDPRQRKSVMDSLRADGLVEFVDLGQGVSGRGKSRTAWVAMTGVEVDAEDEAA